MLLKKTKEADNFVSAGEKSQFIVELDKTFTEKLMVFEPLRKHRKNKSKLCKLKTSKVINEMNQYDASTSKKEKFNLRRTILSQMSN